MIPKVVIIGGGFGGVYTARRLASYADKGLIDVTIISRSDSFLFTPLLHEVATGSLSPTSVAEPLREMFRGKKVNIIEAEVTSIDVTKKIVKLSGSASGCEIPFDYVVYAGGAGTNYYGVAGAAEHGLSMKNIEDAVAIRSRIIDSFEAALVARKNKDTMVYSAEQLSFVVVGGGATGVELAAELAEFVYDTLLPYYASSGIKRSDVSVSLLAASPDLLSAFHPKLRALALRTLVRKGVKVSCGVTVTKVTEDGVTLADGTQVNSSHVIWVAGVRANPTALEDFILTPHPSGRIVTDRMLRVMSVRSKSDLSKNSTLPNVFAIGDASGEYPMLTQVATQQAYVVADNIIASIRNKPLREFSYTSKGSLLSLGQGNAVGSIFGIRISGFIAWFIWRSVYLFKFITWRKRFKVASEWTINLFYPRDVTRVR